MFYSVANLFWPKERRQFQKERERSGDYIGVAIFRGVYFEFSFLLQFYYQIFDPKRAAPLRRLATMLRYRVKIVISISRNGLLKACARFIIERSEIRKKQHAFKSVHFECRMVLFLHDMGEKSTLVDFFSIECRKAILSAEQQ